MIEKRRVKSNKIELFEPLLLVDVVDDGAGVFDPNMEKVFDIPVRLLRPLRPLFIKFAVACDDDENSDEVADEVDVAVTVVPVKFLLAIGVGAADTVAGIVVVAIAVVEPVYPLVIVVAPSILLLLSAALAFGNAGVSIDLPTNGVIVLYGADVWSPNVKWSAVDVCSKLVSSPP